MFILLKSNSTHLPASDHRCWVVNVNTKMKHIQQWAKLCFSVEIRLWVVAKILLVRALHLILSLFLHFSHTIFNYPPLSLSLSLCHSLCICFAFSSFDCFFYLFPLSSPPFLSPTSPSHPFLSAFSLSLLSLCVASFLPVSVSASIWVSVCVSCISVSCSFSSRIHRSSLGTIFASREIFRSSKSSHFTKKISHNYHKQKTTD